MLAKVYLENYAGVTQLSVDDERFTSYKVCVKIGISNG